MFNKAVMLNEICDTNGINIQNGGQRLPLLFTTHSYRHLEGPFLAEIAGQNLVQKRPVGGTKREKQTNNVNNGGGVAFSSPFFISLCVQWYQIGYKEIDKEAYK